MENEYHKQFEENLKEISKLIETPEIMRECALNGIKSLDTTRDLTSTGKIKIKNLIDSLENISKESIRKHYQIIYNQLCVLAVSALSAILEKYFVEFAQQHSDMINFPKNKKIRVFLQSLKEKYNFDVKNNLGQIIIDYDSSINFQDLKSTLETFETYFNKKTNLRPEIEKNIILYQQCRHVIVHKSGIVDEEFLNKTRTSRFKKGEKIQLNGEDWEIMKKSFFELVKRLTAENNSSRKSSKAS